MRQRRRETTIERPVCDKALTRYGVPNIKMVHPGGETGWCDRCFFIPGGKPLLIEFKWPGYEPTPRQDYIHEMLRGLGYDVIWCDNEEDALAAIKQRLDAAQVDPPQVSARGREVPAKARSGGAATRPRHGKDKRRT
jgi:hypothetical protein